MELDQKLVADSQQLVIDVFKGFRDELLGAYGNIEFSRKNDASPVTRLDVTVEQALKNRLLDSFPELGFRGEETGVSGNDHQYWLVDPIDSTSSFIRGIPFCTNMAALIQDDEAIAAVIYDFVTDTLYTAVKGEGSYENGQRIYVNSNRQADDMFVYSLSGHKFNELRKTISSIGARSYYPIGAAGNSYIMLATGKIDGVAVLNTKTNAHDNAPGLLLVSEAGGKIISFDGKLGVGVQEFITGTPAVIDLISQHENDFRALVGR